MRTDIENLDALMLLTQERIKGMQENPKLGSARKVQALVNRRRCKPLLPGIIGDVYPDSSN
jgi:hypothetical protein